MAYVLKVIDHVVVIDPIDADLQKAKSIDRQYRNEPADTLGIRNVMRRNPELKHHDGDDYGDHAI